jgi:hypothetical protein
VTSDELELQRVRQRRAARPGRPPSRPWGGETAGAAAGIAGRAPTWQTEGREEGFEGIPDLVAELGKNVGGGDQAAGGGRPALVAMVAGHGSLATLTG